MATTLPDELRSALDNLGTPTAEYKLGTTHYVLELVGVVLLFLICAGKVAFVVVDVRGQAPGDEGLSFSHMTWFVGALCCMAAGIAVLWRARSRRQLQVLVFADGLARIHAQESQILLWQDINAVIWSETAPDNELIVSKPQRLTLVSRHGWEWKLDEGLTGLRELRELVERRTLAIMLPTALEALETGAAIGFGSVAVSREGWQHEKDRVLHWDQFRELEVCGARVIVYSKDGRKPFGRIGIEEFVNFHVLLALAEHGRTRYG
jgi:hypothetical protein